MFRNHLAAAFAAASATLAVGLEAEPLERAVRVQDDAQPRRRTGGAPPIFTAAGGGSDRARQREAVKAAAVAAYHANTPPDTLSRQVRRANARAHSYRWDTKGTRTVRS